jgi:hypothetical protein
MDYGEVALTTLAREKKAKKVTRGRPQPFFRDCITDWAK